MISTDLHAYAVCNRLQPDCCRQDQARYSLSNAGGTVKYAGSEKCQLVLELIGAFSKAEWPLALYLSDGLTYHRVTLNGKRLFYWEKLEPREALYCMVTDLKEVGHVQGLSSSP